jgi:hypothetical protein
MALQIRRGLEADRTTFIPAQGELLYSTDDKKLYIGDGSTPGGNAVGGGDLVTETTAAQFVHNQHTNITFTYNNINGRIIGSVPGLQIAGDDSTVRTVNLGETIKFSGTGGATVTSDSEGNITINSLTYNVEAVPTGGGAKLRLQSFLTIDDITFVGAGGTTVSALDANTIQINSSGGGGGSGTINAGTATQLAYYTGSTTIDSASNLSYNSGTGVLSTGIMNIPSIDSSSSNFAIFTNNGVVSIGGTISAVERSGRLETVDVNGYNAAAPFNNRFFNVHNDANVDTTAFFRARGTLASPQAVQPLDGLGALSWFGYDGTDYAFAGQIGMITAVSPSPGDGNIKAALGIQLVDFFGNIQTALVINPDKRLDVLGTLFFATDITNTTLRIRDNVIETIASNANLEFRTSGTGAIYLDNVSINQGIIDTLDSSSLQFTPSAVFASDVTVENDLTITNKVYANEFVSTSTSTPEISATTQLLVTVGSQQWELDADGGLKLPILSSAPVSPVIGMYVADGVGWDPDSKSGSVPYPVYYDGSAFNALY